LKIILKNKFVWNRHSKKHPALFKNIYLNESVACLKVMQNKERSVFHGALEKGERVGQNSLRRNGVMWKPVQSFLWASFLQKMREAA
jgi:hypothetical protein